MQSQENINISTKKNGDLGKIAAEIRTEIYNLLIKENVDQRNIPLCQENLIINELIREYFHANGMVHSESVFLNETGQPKDQMNREFLAHNLEIVPLNDQPLLNLLVRKYKSVKTMSSPNEKNGISFNENGFFQIDSN